jgi:predicted metal-dependent peptidase
MQQNLILDINKLTKKILINDIFYGLFLSTIEKKENKDIPLAAVGVNKSTMDFSLFINPDEWFKHSDQVRYGVLLHEAQHLCQFHLITSDMYPNSKMDNVACDLDINQRIDKAYLPSWGIFIDEFRTKHPNLDFKSHAGRHHYYHELNKLSEDEKDQMGISDNAKHVWVITDGEGNKVENLTESEKEALRVQIEHTIENIAEEIKKSQGTIPAEIDQLISGFVKPKPAFNYNKYIRNFVGNSNKFFIKSTKVKENQRFPGQPKIVLKPLNKMLVLVDESGSVSEKELYDFLNEIYHLQKKTDIEIRAFDTKVSDIVKYKGNNEFPRTQCGGTSFTVAVEYFNESKYQSCIIFTDGHAETPPKCNKRLLWVISSNGDERSIQNHSTWIKIPNNG